MNVEGLTIYHVKSHLQVNIPHFLLKQVIQSTDNILLYIYLPYVAQKYRLAKYMPEKKEGNDSSMFIVLIIHTCYVELLPMLHLCSSRWLYGFAIHRCWLYGTAPEHIKVH